MTHYERAQRRKGLLKYFIHGEQLTVSEIANKYGIPRKTIEMRTLMGWSGDDLAKPLVEPMERQVQRYEIDGEELTLREISDRYNVPQKTLRTRRNLGKRGLDLVVPVQQRTHAA